MATVHEAGFGVYEPGCGCKTPEELGAHMSDTAILGWVVAAVAAAGWAWSAWKLSEARRAAIDLGRRLSESRASAEEVEGRLDEAEATARRRVRDAESTAQFANEAFAQRLLPVEDALARALASDGDLSSYREGVGLVHRLLESAFSQSGLQPIRPAAGEPFDPRVHESVGMLPGGSEEGALEIAQVGRAGWTLHDRLLKAAEVVVRRGERVADEPLDDDPDDVQHQPEPHQEVVSAAD